MKVPSRLPSTCVLDWGIGGFGIVAAIFAAAPHARLAYFSDAGATPYGRLTAPALALRLSRLCEALSERGVCHLVLACNAASTVASHIRVPERMQITEMISHGIAVGRAAGVTRLGVLGGIRTIRSGLHARALRRAGIHVIARVAQPLSAYVEAGHLDGVLVRASVARIVRPLRGLGAILLACTHYPALTPLLRDALPGTTLLDPAHSVAQQVVHFGLDQASEGPRLITLTSGSAARTRKAAIAGFGIDPGTVGMARWA